MEKISDKNYDKSYDKKKLLFQMVFGILENSFAIIFTILFASLTDLILQGELERFWQCMLTAIVILLLQTITLYLENRFAFQCKAEYGKWLRDKVYCGLLYRRKEDIDKPNVLNTYNSSIGELQEYIATVADYYILGVTMVIAFAVMLRINMVLLFASVLLIPLAGYLNKCINNRLKNKNDIIFHNKENINYNTKQILDGFYSIKAYGMEEKFTQILAQDTQKLEKLEKEKDKLNAIQGRLSIALRYIPQLVVPLLGGWLCLNGSLTVGQLLAANTVIWYIIVPAENLLEMLKNRKLLQKNREKIQKLVLPAEIEDNICLEESLENNNGNELAVCVENVCFSYDKQRNVLEDASFSVEKGEHVLLIGKSGEGKSTLIRLLCGQKLSDCGNIWIDGKKICRETVCETKQKIIFIPQDPYIFSGTIRENICLGSALEEDVLKDIVGAAGLEAFVDRQENGLEALIGGEGSAISGGQKRRIALARAMAQKAVVYLLDEPFSELDSETSVKLQSRMSEYFANQTVLMISHQDITNWKHKYATYKVSGGKVLHEN